MGGALSKINSKLSFDFAEYVREREELANELRAISEAARSHRQLKGSFQVMNGATGVAAGIAGGVALVTAPATFGLSVPVVATTAAVVGQSITAASLASSVATYGYGHVVDKDIAKRLLNLRHVIDCISKKDKEINLSMKKVKHTSTKESEAEEDKTSESAVKKEAREQPSFKKDSVAPAPNEDCEKSLERTKKNQESAAEATEEKPSSSIKSIRQKPEPPIKACQKLCEVWEEWDLAGKENGQVGFDLALSILKSQGLVLGTRSIIEGSKQVMEEQDLERALLQTAENIDEESDMIRKHQIRFQYFPCVSVQTRGSQPRGRLTFIDQGGGGLVMVVSFDHFGAAETIKSDSTCAIRLPEGVTNVKVHFEGPNGGKPVKKIDRSHPKQPWTKSPGGEVEPDIFDFERGDGIDAVFLIKGSLVFCHVHKAWDFGRPESVPPRTWEWWENATEECKTLVPDIEARSLARSSSSPSECDAPGKTSLFCATCCSQ